MRRRFGPPVSIPVDAPAGHSPHSRPEGTTHDTSGRGPGWPICTAGAGVPTDADGFFDDVNGNGRKDFADVVLFFNQMTWIAEHEPVALFDYNGNGRIDFADVVWLFNHL